MSTKKAIRALRQDNANKFREMIIESLNKKISDLMEDSKKIVGVDIFESKGDLFSRWKMLQEARLDELSKETLKSYIPKAQDDKFRRMSDLLSTSKNDPSHSKKIKKIKNRIDGEDRAITKFINKSNTNEDRLDELSNKKVGEYMVKAEKSIKDMDNERSRATLDRMLSKGPDSKPSRKEDRLFDKAKQRDKYAEKAYKRITK